MIFAIRLWLVAEQRRFLRSFGGQLLDCPGISTNLLPQHQQTSLSLRITRSCGALFQTNLPLFSPLPTAPEAQAGFIHSWRSRRIQEVPETSVHSFSSLYKQLKALRLRRKARAMNTIPF
jgi:hypothetical protein